MGYCMSQLPPDGFSLDFEDYMNWILGSNSVSTIKSQQNQMFGINILMKNFLWNIMPLGLTQMTKMKKSSCTIR